MLETLATPINTVPEKKCEINDLLLTGIKDIFLFLLRRGYRADRQFIYPHHYSDNCRPLPL